jgi:glucose uptake protein GlcU
MTMLQTAVALLAIAAAGGLLMAGIRFFATINPPTWLAMLHGLLAAAGLTLAIYAAATVGVSGSAQLAIVLLVLAAAGGAFLNLVYQWKQQLLPASIVIGHAALAVIGFGLLAKAAFLG